MKNFLDRLAYVFHRPRFFNKAFTAIVTQGVYGGNDILKYFYNVAKFWGFKYSKGVSLTIEPGKNEEKWKKVQKPVGEAAERFHRILEAPGPYKPSWFMLMIFRIVRQAYKANPDEGSRDYRYFRDNGWLGSQYYYDVKPGIFKRIYGAFFDFVGKKTSAK
jgi:hypothetical protein